MTKNKVTTNILFISTACWNEEKIEWIKIKKINPLNQCTCTMKLLHRLSRSHLTLYVLYVEHNWFILSINFGAKITVIRIFAK